MSSYYLECFPFPLFVVSFCLILMHEVFLESALQIHILLMFHYYHYYTWVTGFCSNEGHRWKLPLKHSAQKSDQAGATAA